MSIKYVNNFDPQSRHSKMVVSHHIYIMSSSCYVTFCTFKLFSKCVMPGYNDLSTLELLFECAVRLNWDEHGWILITCFRIRFWRDCDEHH